MNYEDIRTDSVHFSSNLKIKNEYFYLPEKLMRSLQKSSYSHYFASEERKHTDNRH